MRINRTTTLSAKCVPGVGDDIKRDSAQCEYEHTTTLSAKRIPHLMTPCSRGMSAYFLLTAVATRRRSTARVRCVRVSVAIRNCTVSSTWRVDPSAKTLPFAKTSASALFASVLSASLVAPCVVPKEIMAKVDSDDVAVGAASELLSAIVSLTAVVVLLFASDASMTYVMDPGHIHTHANIPSHRHTPRHTHLH